MRIKRLLLAIAVALSGTVALEAVEKQALVDISVACVRAAPSHASELVTQQLMGLPVKIISNDGEWSQVETIDGYRGYVRDNSLTFVDDAAYDRWRAASRAVFIGRGVEAKVKSADGKIISDIVPGSIVELVAADQASPFAPSEVVRIALPDGRQGYLPASSVMPLSQWATQPFDHEVIIGYARANIGSPYLWGGMSAKAMDCSGLTWVAYFLNGRLLPRDANDQAATCEVEITEIDDLKPGNLIFFGPRRGRVNHVAIIESTPRYLESSGLVRENSLSASATSFLFGLDLSDMPPIGASERANWLFLKN